MNILKIIIHFFTFNYPHYVISLLVKVGLMGALFLFVKRNKPWWKNLAYCLLLILLFRIVLFEQYYSWGFYTDQLMVDDVGWRQKSVLDYEHSKFFKDEQKLKFLAMGSSQTYVVYLPYSEKHKDLSVFHLSSMSPLDFYLYRKYVADRDPKYVLLYLSEFDLAKEPSLDAAKMAPSQGIDFFNILPMLFEISKQTHSETALKEMIVGEFSPEYRHSFVFRGFSEKLMKKNKALHVETLFAELHPDKDALKKDIEGVLEGMDERWIKYNTY